MLFGLLDVLGNFFLAVLLLTFAFMSIWNLALYTDVMDEQSSRITFKYCYCLAVLL